jgi:replicative DNA helicase
VTTFPAARRHPASTNRVLASLNEERSALGAALLDAQQAAELLHAATPDFFTYEAYRHVFEAMQRLAPPYDANVIASELERAGLFYRVGWACLVSLEDGVVTALPMSRRLDRLRDLWQLREIRTLLNAMHKQIQEPFSKGVDAIATIRQRLEEIENR